MDWSGIPPELLHLISKKFHKISDLIHFRGVCKAWRASASIFHLPPQIPCFLTPPDSGSTTLHFHSPTSGETHSVDVPLCVDQTILGSSNGYLLIRHLSNLDLSLLNPVTNSKISLPFLQTKRPVLVWVSPDHVPTDDYTVCILGNSGTPNRLSAFWRPGELKWTTINNGSTRSCYHQGMYLTLLPVSKVVVTYDVAAKALPDLVLPPPGEGPFCPPGALVYLVVSDGQVLRVLEHDDKYLSVHGCRFDIYRLDFGSEKEQPFWVKINNIGDQMLFLNVWNGFSVSASCFEGFRGNSIYFLKEVDNGASYGSTYVLCRYDIKAGTAEMLPFPCVTGGMWFLRSLQYV